MVIPGTPKVVKPRVCSLVPIIPPLSIAVRHQLGIRAKPRSPHPLLLQPKPENKKTSQPNPMTKINLIYLPHEICAAAIAAAAEAAAKALIHTNTPTQTNPNAKPNIPLRSRL